MTKRNRGKSTDVVAHIRGLASADRELRSMLSEFEILGLDVGTLVNEKQQQYGDSAGRSGQILFILYPDGVFPYQYDDMLLTARVLDKLSRISQRKADGKDLGGESPWKDITGYGLLGLRKDMRREKIG
jgi:hypothetical protein